MRGRPPTCLTMGGGPSPLLTSSLRATWQMCTGRWCSCATIRTAATVCPSAWATMGKCRGHCWKCCGNKKRWVLEPTPSPSAIPPPAAAHLHPQRHIIHAQAGEGVVEVQLQPCCCCSQRTQ